MRMTTVDSFVKTIVIYASTKETLAFKTLTNGLGVASVDFAGASNFTIGALPYYVLSPSESNTGTYTLVETISTP